MIATDDAEIDFAGGFVKGVSNPYEGVNLTNSDGTSTAAGRQFLLAREGLSIATLEEVQRAKQGSTAGSVIKLDPPREIYTASRGPSNPLPMNINEYGIESREGTNRGWIYTPDGLNPNPNLWHVVRIDEEQ